MKNKHFWTAALLFMLTMALTGCGGQTETTAATSAAAEKTVLTITLPYKTISSFEAAFEAAYPAYDLQVEQLATGVINGEISRRLRNGHGADLIVTNLPMGEVWQYAYDISTEDFSESYQAQMMKTLSQGGVLKYLPLPGSLYGYVINKTLLDELGQAVPETSGELLAALAASKEKNLGVSADGYNFGLGTIGATYSGAYFVSAFAPDFLSTVEGVRWVAAFEEQQATFSGSWEGCASFLKACVDEGYMNAKKLIMYYNQAMSSTANAFKPEVELPARTALAAYVSLDIYNEIVAGSQDEFVLLPCLPASTEGNALVSAVANDFLFINNALSSDPVKLEGAKTLMRFLSTEQGQKLWMADTSCPYSYLSGIDPDYSLIPESLHSCFTNGQVYINPFPTDLLTVIGTQLVSAVSSGGDISAALAAIDDYVINGSEEIDYDMSVVGTVAEDMICADGNVRKEETQLGNLIADAIRELTGADVALVNGGGIRSSLYKGDVTGSDLNAVCPYANTIIVSKMSGAILKAAVTNGIQKTWKPAGQFLQVSGIRYSYKPAADETQTAELLSLTHADGTPVTDDEMLTVAYTNYMGGSGGYVDSGDGYTMLNVYDSQTPVGVELILETGKTFRDALVSYFAAHAESAISVRL